MKSANRQRGFTLIEVLVAIVVIGLAASATANGMRATTNLLGENSLQGEAITLAQGAMEDLRTLRYEDIGNGSRAEGVYTVAWTALANNPETGMKFITVTTSWQWKGQPRSFKIETIYSKIIPN